MKLADQCGKDSNLPLRPASNSSGKFSRIARPTPAARSPLPLRPTSHVCAEQQAVPLRQLPLLWNYSHNSGVSASSMLISPSESVVILDRLSLDS